MLIHPQFDPVAIYLGPLSIRWYGLMYLLGFALFILLGRYHIKRNPQAAFNNTILDDLLFYGMLVVRGSAWSRQIFDPLSSRRLWGWPLTLLVRDDATR